MILSIKNSLYQSIIQGKWVDISYINKDKEETRYYISILDIDIKNNTVRCDIFNPYKSLETTKNVFIKINNIKTAEVLNHSSYEPPVNLLNKINNDQDIYDYLGVVNFDNNILKYLSDCYRLDDDPFIKSNDYVVLDGVDLKSLREAKRYQLDDSQFKTMLDKVFKRDKEAAEEINRYKQLVINRFAIDIGGKPYIIAYRNLSLDFENKTLVMGKKIHINKSFLVEDGKKITLSKYLDINPDAFCLEFEQNERECVEMISGNFQKGERINTVPMIFFLSRRNQRGVDTAFESIFKMDKENKLTTPLKSFYGRNRSRNLNSKDTNIVVFDKSKVNIDQMRVIYNSMLNHVTYVKGPPGTGKTETIFNIVLSAYANDRSVLICSNNNHPVDDIFDKMDNFLKRKKYGKEEKVFFPMIRINNNAEMSKTLMRLKEILSFAMEHKDDKTSTGLTEMSKNKSMSDFSELKELLSLYEDRLDQYEKIQVLEKIKNISQIPQLEKKLEEEIEEQRRKYNLFRYIKDEDVMKCVVSASEDYDFQNYLYYSSIFGFRRLLSENFKELREIIEMEDMEESTKLFNSYLKEGKNLRRFISLFPIVLCSNQSSDKLGSPKPYFDLCIMDEAGQCNIASSLIPIVRATDLVLVGDTNQLQPVTVLDQSMNDELKAKYNIGDEYDYIHNSILSTMLRKDTNSKSILLRYHYRCGDNIARFVNKRFYAGELKLQNKKPGELIYLNVENKPNPVARNSYREEALAIVKVIKKNGYKDVGIITPFVNQANLINLYLDREGINDIRAGTIHSLQGSEKSTIIMSAALSLKTSRKTMEWVKNNHELINVGVTRAKEQLIFVGDKVAIDTLSGKEDNDIRVLSDYVYKNGDVYVPQCDVAISSDFSNNSANEKEFFDTVKHYFAKRSKFKIERNVPVVEAIPGMDETDLLKAGKKEFDVVIKVAKGIGKRKYHPIVVFEIDGGEHIGSKDTARRDRKKEELCKKHGIKLIRIANSQVKDYELIINTFEAEVNKIHLDEVMVQGSLFE